MEWGFAHEFNNLERNGDLPIMLRTWNGRGDLPMSLRTRNGIFASKFLQLEMEKGTCL